jgi:hypothetical protein
MTNGELQKLLAEYPADMPVKLMPKINNDYKTVVDLDEDNILHSSETAYVDTEAPEDEWDTEDGKVELGDGQQYLLFNPIII